MLDPQSVEESQTQLLCRIATKDKQALAVFYDQMAGLLYSMAVRILGDPHDAEEVIQQRLSVARREIAEWKYFDYLIVSTSIAEDLRRMECILEAEKMRPSRARAPVL